MKCRSNIESKKMKLYLNHHKKISPWFHSLKIISNHPVYSFLVGYQRAFCVERALAVFNATEKCNLVCDTKQCPVFLALVSIKTTFVQETNTTVAILTDMSLSLCIIVISFKSEIKGRTTISFEVLKRAQIAPMLTCSHSINHKI